MTSVESKDINVKSVIVTLQGAIEDIARSEISEVSASEKAVLPLNYGFVFVLWTP